LIALVAAGSIASTAIGAGQRPWTPVACGDEPGQRAAVVGSAAPISLGDLHRQAWFRLDPRLDREGTLQGQRLALGLDGARSSRIMDLPPEAFAAGPFGGAILVGSDGGSTSRLEVVDVAGECSWTVAEEAAVIRRATIDPDGRTIYEMRVDRLTRADLGIWTRPLDGSIPAGRILEPIGADERFGRTYATDFAWDLSGRTLAIQSCGEAACRTRILDLSDGTVRVVAEPDLGELVGLEGDVVVSYAVCPGLPCPIVATDAASGSRSILAEAGAVAVAISTPDGPRLVHEVFDEAGARLRSVSFDGARTTDLGQLPDGLRLHPSTSVAEAATRLPSDWVLLSPDGRLPGTGPNGRTQLRHVSDGTTVQLDEVAR
jgi:hypothetical protein